MRYLLDTHVVLWYAEDSLKLSDKAKNAIMNENAEKYVSIISAWEIAIKLTKNQLTIDGGLSEYFRITDKNGFVTLPVERAHLNLIQTLSDYHKDPFDRLIIATAIAEKMTIITVDENIHKYNIPIIW